MPQYLVAIHHPRGYDRSKEDEAMVRDINALNEELDAAGARVFAGGLEPPSMAKSLHKAADGEVVITDGPYLESKELVGGFWLLNCANIEEALAWGRKATIACRAPVEVRAFLRIRPDRSPKKANERRRCRTLLKPCLAQAILVYPASVEVRRAPRNCQQNRNLMPRTRRLK
jgi:hypothetical protein